MKNIHQELPRNMLAARAIADSLSVERSSRIDLGQSGTGRDETRATDSRVSRQFAAVQALR